MANGTGSLTMGGVTDNRPRKLEQAVEVGVFIFLILPSMVLSFLATGQGGLSFPVGGAAIIFRDLALVSLVLFFIWRNRERPQDIGWGRVRWQDVLLGIALYVPMAFAAYVVEAAAQAAGLSPGPKSLPAALSPQGGAQYALASIMVVVVALSEETIFRGYLIHRLRTVTGSAAAAVVLSSLIFSVGHGYEGSAGVVTVGFMGLIFALVYVWRGSLTAPIIMHFLQDFLGIVVAPILGLR